MDGLLGLAGWKWVYIIEAIPTVLIGVFVLFALTDKPENAKWLCRRGEGLADHQLARERSAVDSPAGTASGRR